MQQQKKITKEFLEIPFDSYDTMHVKVWHVHDFFKKHFFSGQLRIVNYHDRHHQFN